MWLVVLVLALAGFGVLSIVFILASALFFGGDDPYERELFMMDEHDYMLDSMRRDADIRNSTNAKNTLNVDARSVHKYDIHVKE